jgi:HPt (histidine-containing phosphotransfer) domain-containing protein
VVVTPERQEQVDQLIREMWLRNRPVALARAAVVQAALHRAVAGDLLPAERVEALSEAHRLRGILGTYGFPEGSVLAAEAEEALAVEAGGVVADDLPARWAAYARTLATDAS